MSRHNSETYDVVIIGAGISGLVCGCYLARAGMKVLLVEQHDKPGGYCTSFMRKGFTFDAAAHSFGSYREGGNFRKILHELGIDKKVRISRFDPSDVLITPDFTATFWNNTTDTINELGNIFPAEKSNIDRYFSYYNDTAPADQFESVKLKDKSYADFLSSFFTNKTLMSAISFPVLGNGGLPPSMLHAFTGTKIFREFMVDGGYYPEGGMQNLPNALAAIVKENTGAVLYKTLVKRILTKKNIAIGVELDNQTTVYSKYIVSACDVTQTFQSLLGKAVVGEKIAGRLAQMVPSISTFTLYLGIDMPFTGLPQAGTNIWHLPHYDLDTIYNDITLGDIKNFGGGGFMFRVSPDKKTILAFCGAPYKTTSFWEQNKKKIAENFLSRLEQRVPGIRSHVAFFDASTPHTLYRYTLNYEGANYGWAPTQKQLFDPDFRQKSPVQGLYLTGHWTAQTHGIPGVAYLGYTTAKLILNREKPNT